MRGPLCCALWPVPGPRSAPWCWPRCAFALASAHESGQRDSECGLGGVGCAPSERRFGERLWGSRGGGFSPRAGPFSGPTRIPRDLGPGCCSCRSPGLPCSGAWNRQSFLPRVFPYVPPSAGNAPPVCPAPLQVSASMLTSSEKLVPVLRKGSNVYHN